MFLSLISKGEHAFPWYSQDTLLKNGVFKNYGFISEAKSFGVIFNNPSNQPITYYLKINNPHINKLVVFNTKGDTLFLTGDQFQFNSRPVYFWEYVFPIKLDPNSRDSIRFDLYKNGETLAFHTLMFPEKNFPKIHDAHLYFYSTFLSISIFLVLIFIFLGIYKNETKHYLFAAFIFTSAGWALNERGIFFQYIWPSNIALHERIDTFFATPSLGFVIFILFFNETYKSLISKRLKSVLIFTLFFLPIRTILVFFYPDLNDSPTIKTNLLRISTFIVIVMILVFILNLIRFGIKRILFLDTLGFIVYFSYLLKLALRQNNLDFILTERFHGFAYPLMQTVTIGIFSMSNYLKYRKERKEKQDEENEIALNREKEMTEKILAVQENERETIGRNIHDQVGGLLATARIKLETIKLKNEDEQLNKDIDGIITIMNRSSTEVYQIIDELVPPTMKGETLSSIIKSRIEIIEQSTAITFKVEIEEIVLEQNLMLKLYRILSELISNSIKHANCKNIQINFSQNKTGYSLDYFDDGLGFNNQIGRNHGINNIESRVKYLNGTIHFYSVPGKTHYSIHIPHTQHEK